ncbi:MAG: hypothetical protein AAB532_03545 [Patescibacteria group bacterium]
MTERFRIETVKSSDYASALLFIRKGLGLPTEEPLPDLRERYFDSPTFSQLLGLRDHPGIQYVRPVNLASDNLSPSEKLKSMLLGPLAQRIEDEFRGRSIALQGLACSVTSEIRFPDPNGDPTKRRVIKSAQGLLNPSVREGLSRLPIYLPNTTQSLLNQDLPAFEFMIASARGARIRASEELHTPRLRSIIFPAMLVIDLEQTAGYQVLQIPGGNQQVISLNLTGDRKTRSKAVLGLYVTDYPKIISGASKRKIAK